MEQLFYFFYNVFFIPVFYAGFYIGGFFNSKIKEGIRGRKGLFKTIGNFANLENPGKQRILFHCASIGEWEQAVPIIRKIKEGNPDVRIIVSFFSPSGYNFSKKHPDVDLKIYLPLDSRLAARKFFRLLKPSLWVISKFDVWPNHLYVAASMKIPVIMTAATLSSNSGRIKGIAKAFNSRIYNKFSHIFPISEDDKNRFLEIFNYPDKMTITGDTRFDQVYFKGQQALKAGDVNIFKNKGGIRFIAGSIWPADEKHLIPALVSLLKKFPDLRAILVPHELHEGRLRAIETVLEEAGIESERYTAFTNKGGTEKRVAIINTIGLLARIYKQTDFAYIGGSFSTGVHNVMEPAVFGQPVVFGPVYVNSFEAMQLMKTGSAFAVNNSSEAVTVLARFITEPDFRKKAGRQAYDLIMSNLGATDKTYNKLIKLYDFISQNNPD